MQTAQGQADALLATGGEVGHTRPNGMTFTQQLLLLGYPLSGDLSLGGYRSENFVFGYQLAPLDAVEAWRGDEPHTNTMISPDRSDIGAGVAIAGDGTVYYVIDTALRTASGLPQSDADDFLPGGGSGALDPESAINQYIVPVAISTARPDGNVYHTVQYGQSLWGIAIAYGTKIDQIRALNHLGSSNTVYPNQMLLVKQGATQPAVPTPTGLVASASSEPLMTDTIARAEDAILPALPATPAAEVSGAGTPVAPQPSSPASSLSIWIAVIVFLLVAGGGSAVWFIREPGQ
jgi:LysM repeat protein